MAIVTKVFIIAALVCMVVAMPLEGQEQEAQVDLLSVNEVPQQDANAISDSPVRQKRHGYYGGECCLMNRPKFRRIPLIDHKT